MESKKVGLLMVLLVQVLAINRQCVYESGLSGSNSSCPLNSICLPNNYCACESGFIGNCSQQTFLMENNVEIQTNLSNLEYTFFSVSQSTDSYVVLIFNLCHEQSNENTESIDVWDDESNIEILDKSNALPGGKNWSINQGCLMLSTPFLQFQKQPNGLPVNFIIGMKLVKPGSIPISLSVQINVFDFWDLLQKFLIIIGGIFFILFGLAVAVIVYKWRRRNIHENRRAQNDISHLNIYMPKFKLNSQTRRQLVEQLCSVCLIEFVDGESLRKTTCQHVFHLECIDEWCRLNLNCPICRNSLQEKDILQYTRDSIESGIINSEDGNKQPLL